MGEGLRSGRVADGLELVEGAKGGRTFRGLGVKGGKSILRV